MLTWFKQAKVNVLTCLNITLQVLVLMQLVFTSGLIDSYLCFSDNSDLPSDTKAALLYLRSIFPVEKFEGRLPPIVHQHQLYSIVKNRTTVDKELVSYICIITCFKIFVTVKAAYVRDVCTR